MRRFGDRRRVEQLRTDVTGDAADVQVGQGAGASIERLCIGEGNAELVALEAGGNVGVRFRVNIRIDAQGDRRLRPELGGNGIETFEFGCGFDIEAADAGAQRLAHLVARLAHTSENHLVCAPSGCQHACELAT